MLPVGAARRAGRYAGLLLMLALVSCGTGDGGGEGDRPTISPTRTPTATLTSTDQPSPTGTTEPSESAELPSPTRSTDRTESPELPSPTRTTDETETPDDSASPTTSEPPTTQETASETPAPTTEETPEPADTTAEEPDDEEGVPTWAWWVLAGLIVAAFAIPLVLRTQRRSAWRQEVAAQEGELVWLARELLPGLRQAGSRDVVAGGWAVGEARVAAAEDRLTVLESSAPDEAGRQRALALRDAARQARARMDRLTGPASRETLTPGLDAIIADLEATLRTSPVSSSA